MSEKTDETTRADTRAARRRDRRAVSRRWLIGAGAAVVAAGAAGGIYLATRDGNPPIVPVDPPADWEPRDPTTAADLDTKWLGTQTHTVSDVAQFEDLVGTPVRTVVVFGAENDWPAITGPWFAMDPPDGQDWGAWVRDDPDNRTLVVSTAMVPEDPPSDWRERGAAGEYDQYWKEFGQNLVDTGLGSSIIRIGWEMNGDWYETHYIGDTEELREAWKEYFRRMVMAMEVEGSDFEIDFNIAEGPQDSVGIEDMYPGDEYVDIIGIDVYDSYISPIDPDARWQAKDEKVNSVSAVAAFAAGRNKPLSFPEWAMVAEGDTQGGGDSPEFINQIADAVRDNDVRYQAYFNSSEGGVGMTLADAPQGLKAYAERFGPTGDARPTDS